MSALLRSRMANTSLVQAVPNSDVARRAKVPAAPLPLPRYSSAAEHLLPASYWWGAQPSPGSSLAVRWSAATQSAAPAPASRLSIRQEKKRGRLPPSMLKAKAPCHFRMGEDGRPCPQATFQKKTPQRGLCADSDGEMSSDCGGRSSKDRRAHRRTSRGGLRLIASAQCFSIRCSRSCTPQSLRRAR